MKKNLVKRYLENDGALCLDLARQIYSYNGSDTFDFVDAWDPDELIEMQCTDVESAKELIRAICYGGASVNSEYWRYNGYGNIESISKYELQEEALGYIDEIIEELEDWYYRSNINISDTELRELVEAEDEMIIKFLNIVYDYDHDDDGECEAVIESPTTLEITIEENDFDEECLADLISDETGWCVKSFDYEIIHRDSEEEN